MSLHAFILTCLWLVDAMLPLLTGGNARRAGGPWPRVSDSQVLTMEIVGSALGNNQQKDLFA